MSARNPENDSVIRLGIFDYVNIWPVYNRFLSGPPPEGIELVSGNPNELNRALREGSVDLSPISSIQYPLLHSDVFLVPSLALACSGKVKSVFLVTRDSRREIPGGKIFATSASSTSTILLKILLRHSGGDAEIVPCDDPFTRFEEEGDGCLLIGDDALLLGASTGKHHLHDLGEWWFSVTGKPFVWALWGMRKSALEAASPAMKALLESREAGLKRLDEIAAAAAARLGLSPAFLKSYYENFSYYLNDAAKEGLLLFYEHAAKMKLAPACTRLEFAPAEVGSWR